jgi:Mechanosensitive ion channel, conserved TM helix
METRVQDQFLGLADNIIAYLPSLLAGIILVLIGWIAGWLIKRVLVQISVLLRADRFLRRSRWEADFAKADVRYGLYNFIGNIGYTLVFLLFLDNALIAWKLTVLSDLLSKGILYLPKIIIAFSIFGLGWLLSFWAEKSILKSLNREEIPRASLISRFIKIILLLFFSAIALVELDVAREIVIIGFATIFITIGSISIVITAIGGKSFLEKIGNSFNEMTQEKHE